MFGPSTKDLQKRIALNCILVVSFGANLYWISAYHQDAVSRGPIRELVPARLSYEKLKRPWNIPLLRTMVDNATVGRLNDSHLGELLATARTFVNGTFVRQLPTQVAGRSYVRNFFEQQPSERLN